jgi:hypothetical protein
VNRPTLDYRSPDTPSRRRPAGNVASAIVGLTIFGLAALLVFTFTVWTWVEGDSKDPTVLVLVLLPLGIGVWVNARTLSK